MFKFLILTIFFYFVLSSHLGVGQIKPRNINIKINSSTQIQNQTGQVVVSNSVRSATYKEEYSFNINEYNGKIQPNKNYIIHAKCLLNKLDKYGK
jgi:hypothetical protein